MCACVCVCVCACLCVTNDRLRTMFTRLLRGTNARGTMTSDGNVAINDDDDVDGDDDDVSASEDEAESDDDDDDEARDAAGAAAVAEIAARAGIEMPGAATTTTTSTTTTSTTSTTTKSPTTSTSWRWLDGSASRHARRVRLLELYLRFLTQVANEPDFGADDVTAVIERELVHLLAVRDMTHRFFSLLLKFCFRVFAFLEIDLHVVYIYNRSELRERIASRLTTNAAAFDAALARVATYKVL